MKCKKCDKEVSGESKYCSNCGTEVKQKSLCDEFEEAVKICSESWFLLGYLRGCNRKNKKGLDELEKILRNIDEDLWIKYNDIVEFLKNWIKEKENGKKFVNSS